MKQNYNSGLTSLSPIIAQAANFVDEKIAKKEMNEDQKAAYLFSLKNPELAGMIAQVQRTKQILANAPKTNGPPAAPPTVKDATNAELQAAMQGNQQPQLNPMQMMQQSQMQDPRMAQQMPQGTQQGLPAIQAAGGGLMYAAPMERGLGGLDAGSMNDAQYANGGIVSFASGGALLTGLARKLAIPAAVSYGALKLFGGDNEEPLPPKDTIESVTPVNSMEARNQFGGRSSSDTDSSINLSSRSSRSSPNISKINSAVQNTINTPLETRAAAIERYKKDLGATGYEKLLGDERSKTATDISQLNAKDQKQFWLSFAKGAFGAKGSNFFEQLSSGAPVAMEAYQKFADKKEAVKEKLQAKEFELNRLTALAQQGVIDKADSALATATLAAAKLAAELRGYVHDEELVRMKIRSDLNIAKLSARSKTQLLDLDKRYSKAVDDGLNAKTEEERNYYKNEEAAILEARRKLTAVSPQVVVRGMSEDFVTGVGE